MKMKLNSKLTIIPLIVVALVVVYFLVPSELAIVSDEGMIRYNGEIVNGDMKQAYDTPMELDFKVGNYQGTMLAIEWFLEVSVESPSNVVYSTSYHSKPHPSPEYYLTDDYHEITVDGFTGDWDEVGKWHLTRCDLYANVATEGVVMLDEFSSDEDIAVVYDSGMDITFTSSATEVDVGDTVTLTLGATLNDPTTGDICWRLFADPNNNQNKDTGESYLLDDCVTGSDTFSDSYQYTVASGDLVGDYVFLCCEFTSFVDNPGLWPTVDENFETVTLTTGDPIGDDDDDTTDDDDDDTIADVIKVYAKDESGNLLNGATILIINSENEYLEETTSSSGYVEFTDMPTGGYTLRGELSGYNVNGLIIDYNGGSVTKTLTFKSGAIPGFEFVVMLFAMIGIVALWKRKK